jgi:hypothetical protein
MYRLQLGKESILSRSSEWSRGLGPTRLGGRVVRLINETLVAALNHLFANFVFLSRSEDRFQDSASFFFLFWFCLLLVVVAFSESGLPLPLDP